MTLNYLWEIGLLSIPKSIIEARREMESIWRTRAWVIQVEHSLSIYKDRG